MLRYIQQYPPKEGPGPDWAKDEETLGVVFCGAHHREVGAAEKIENLMRYETTNRRSLDRALDRLKKLQTARIATLEPVEISAEIMGVDASLAEPLDLAHAASADRLKDLQSARVTDLEPLDVPAEIEPAEVDRAGSVDAVYSGTSSTGAG